MCILFLSISNDPQNGPYKLILASNRDEFYKRPTSTAHFWSPEDSNILGGQDLEAGKEGGTWLALSRTGKIGALLNILAPKTEKKQGRGFLIKEFLQSQGLEFGQEVKEKAIQYEPFSLVMINLLSPDGPSVKYHTNSTCSEIEYPIELTSNGNPASAINGKQNGSGFYAFGNSVYNTPFKKVEIGKQKFTEIVENHKHLDKLKLIQELLAFLRNQEKNYPDEQLTKQSCHLPDSILPHLTCRFIRAPDVGYGTRIQTIILINHENAVEFHEWSLESPMNPESQKWLHSLFEFDL